MQQRVACLLAMGLSAAWASRELGIGAETVSRWKTGNPAFVAQIERALNDNDAAIRLQAAGLVLNWLRRLHQPAERDPERIRVGKRITIWLCLR